MGTTLHVDLVPLPEDEHRDRPIDVLSMEERRSPWLYRAIAAVIQADPARALAVARENLATMRGREGTGAASRGGYVGSASRRFSRRAFDGALFDEHPVAASSARRPLCRSAHPA